MVEKEINRLQGREIDEDDDISYGSYDGEAEDDFDEDGYDDGDMGDDGMEEEGEGEEGEYDDMDGIDE